MLLKVRRSIWNQLNYHKRTFSISHPLHQRKALILGVYTNAEETNSDETKSNDNISGTAFFDSYEKSANRSLSSVLKLSSPLKTGSSRIFHGFDDKYSAICVASLGPINPDMQPLEGLDVAQENIRKGISAAVKSLKDLKINEVHVDPTLFPKAAAEGAVLSTWNYKESERKKFPTPISGEESEKWNEGKIFAEGQNFARHLMDTPANMMDPTIFSETVKEKIEACGTKGEVKVLIRDENWIKDQKMEAFLGVAKGSSSPPKFLEIHYKGVGMPAENSNPLILVGKGVTFDSGGISIKPSQGMGEMRADMGGAATVASAILIAAQMNVPGHVIGFIPLCENLINGRALKPGDVVTAKDGTTIQVDDTDAEGRLLLADTLCYSRDYKPSAVLDIATLTGAMAVALGAGATGVFTNCDDIWNKLHESGYETGDRMWRMPLFQCYADQVKPSHLADLNNIGKGGRWGGACTAAAFLHHFIQKGTRWAHMDMAGVMTNESGQVPYIGPGMAGRPTRTLAEFIMRFCN